MQFAKLLCSSKNFTISMWCSTAGWNLDLWVMIAPKKQKIEFWKVWPCTFNLNFLALCQVFFCVHAKDQQCNFYLPYFLWNHCMILYISTFACCTQHWYCVYCEKSKGLLIYCVCRIDIWFLKLYIAVDQHAQTNETF